ncbi:unnamed protein product [Somion occarium]|uniref:RING-type domain-containing protein n=1 Tax=Somion occarium TaxID=3059160 RepID=A0ABP1CXC0_9APHY
MSAGGRGMPLLSGPPPSYDLNETSCRKCNKEFNMLFARSRKCNHCGHSYCHSCTDYQALMPRSGTESGYDPMPVCAFCIENLTITAGGRSYLRSLPMSRLKKYANAYNIKTRGALEKDEFIDALLAARQPNGCLPPANENYYRKHSVPDRSNDRPRGFFSRAMDAVSGERPATAPPPQQQPRQRTTSHPSTFPRPDTRQQQQQQQRPQYHYQQRSQPQTQWQHPPYAQYAPPPGYPPGYQPYQGAQARQGRPTASNSSNLNVPQTQRPRSASVPREPPEPSRPTTPPAPVPSLDELLDMTDREMKALSIGTLKAILFRNHVNARLVVEKSELVSKVKALVEEEKKERAEAARRAEQEEIETRERLQRLREQVAAAAASNRPQSAQSAAPPSEVPQGGEAEAEADEGAAVAAGATEGTDVEASIEDSTSVELPKPPKTPPTSTASPAPPGIMTPKAQAMASHLERTGLCVICQDEEANIAIVDCGHLAMCRSCADLIMSSTRECPLCRTRIVTEARLLRIFKS